MKTIMFTVMLALLLSAHPAAPLQKFWYVIIDKNGVCKVIGSTRRTPKSLLGSYKYKEQAKAARDRVCKQGIQPGGGIAG